MTLTLNIPAEVEREIRAAAEATGTDVQAFMVQAAQKEARALHPVTQETEAAQQERRRKAIRQARGALAPLPFSINYVDEKNTELALEEAKAYGSFGELGKDSSQ